MQQLHFKATGLIICIVLLLCDVAYACGCAEYKIGEECCPMRAPGSRVYRHCTEYTSTSCIPCVGETFIDEPNGLSGCFRCAVCDPGLGLKTHKACTSTSDAVHGPLDQHYCIDQDKKGCRAAQRRTNCKPGQFIKQNGTEFTDTICGDCLGDTYSDGFFTSCKPHTNCESKGLYEVKPGNPSADTECGEKSLVGTIVGAVIGSVIVVASVSLFLIKKIAVKLETPGNINITANRKRRASFEGKRPTFTEGGAERIRTAHSVPQKICIVLLLCDVSYACGRAEYKIGEECCPMCAPGSRVYKHCTEYTSTSCAPCVGETFIDEPSGLTECFRCAVCDPGLGLRIYKACTSTSDAVCGPLDQHYCTDQNQKKGCRGAQRHTDCKPGQFIKQNGTASTDTICGDCVGNTYSDGFFTFCKPHTDCESKGLYEVKPGNASADTECGEKSLVGPIVGAVIGSVIVVASVSFFLINRWRKQKQGTQPSKTITGMQQAADSLL